MNIHRQVVPGFLVSDEILTTKVSAPDAVCLVVSSRIFFPGSHPVRGVQVMKVGKLLLHQGMFPQAMKNLRLVSVPRLGSAWCTFLWLLPVLYLTTAKFCF